MPQYPVKSTTSPFDTIRQMENGREYWRARDLQALLEYTKWQNFEEAIKRAMISCQVAGEEVSDHFTEISKMINLGKGGQREVKDYKLTRFACYSIAMNGDVEKPSIALAQAYFNIQIRKAELAEASPPINTLWEWRLTYFNKHTRLPHGYWCVFGMMAAYCWTDEFRGIHLLENALPDGSIGKKWCDYLRQRGLDMRQIRKYPHHYPDQRGTIEANIYPNAWLGEFWTWFHGHYLTY
ncbi:MAG: hypothetical protein J2P36_38270, partial [Ktedonobacteraceae bacterium]|nr:hypothetical protein [Ktedonobacteraceae bacterium]